MKLTAIIAARNEAFYIGRCCEHLSSEGIAFLIIDNESTDATREIASSFRGRGLVDVVRHPYSGFFDWTGLLKLKENISRELDSDWFLHLDADEIPEAPRRGQRLIDALHEVDAAGATLVNFDEFVFAPTTYEERHEGGDYVATMQRYFYHERLHVPLLRAWRKASDVDLIHSGGHSPEFQGRVISPESFVLRHYITLSMEHLIAKYRHHRVYAENELARGWHGWRATIDGPHLQLPEGKILHDVRTDGGWNRSHPVQKYAFLR
jgi:glycosyltransferase involved in cell wall biosynthesis